MIFLIIWEYPSCEESLQQNFLWSGFNKVFSPLNAGMRGSTPLDVAAASCIDNNELALALQEQDLEMVGANETAKK